MTSSGLSDITNCSMEEFDFNTGGDVRRRLVVVFEVLSYSITEYLQGVISAASSFFFS